MARILVIDDNPALRDALCELLQQAGHKTVAMATGRQAAQLHRADPVQLVITDIFMPETDGLEIIAEFRRDYPEVKIIAVSGGGSRGMVELLSVAHRMGAQRVLMKPFDIHALLAAVSELLNGTDDGPHPDS
jgi:DNA-binding response OmpR family regulator